MKIFLSPPVFAALLGMFLPSIGNTQYSEAKNLFDSDKPLQITLTGNIRELFNDRAENAKYHPLNLLYKEEADSEVSLSIEARTRGHFRNTVGNCTYPPLLLHFSKSDTLLSSIFKDQNKLKLVMPCRGDEYVIREWLVYKIYNLITPKSFRARLIKVSLFDMIKKKATTPSYGILLEEERQLAKRNQAVLVNGKRQPQEMDHDNFLKMTVFEYLIGNTDWSIQYLQNIRLLAPDSNAIPTPVPYDFDHAGLVNAAYAKPAEELKMNSVRERRYRGYCINDMREFDEVVNFYNDLKTDIFNLYANCALLDIKYVKSTISYFDEFYKTINNPATLKKEFGYPCDKNGTGNVVIKGLKED